MAEEGQICAMSQLGQWRGGGTPAKEVASYWGGDIPWVSPKDMTEGAIRGTLDRLTKAGAARLELHSPGDIAVVFRSGILRRAFPVARGAVRFTVNQDMKVLHPSPNVDAGYAFHVLRGLERRVVDSAVKSGTTVESVDSEVFYQMPIYVPQLAEQRAIAEILDTVDAAIFRTVQLIAKLQQVKQGLQRDLFARGIDENGELRDPVLHPEDFKNSAVGRIPSDWTVEPFASRCVSSAFGPRFSSDLYTRDGRVATLRTTDMDDEGNITLQTMPRAAIAPDAMASHLLVPGDLLISRSGTCGIAAVFPGYEMPVLPGAFLIRFRLHDRVFSEFFRRYFNSTVGRPRLDRLAVGGVQKNIKGSEVLAMSVPVCSRMEAERTVEIIDSVGDSVREEGAELMKLRLVKAGLMEDLLTGSVGVTKLLEGDAA